MRLHFVKSNIIVVDILKVCGLSLESKVSKKKSIGLVPVSKRSAAILIPLIRKYVLLVSIIISDQWKAYASLKERQYINSIINFEYRLSSSLANNKDSLVAARQQINWRKYHERTVKIFPINLTKKYLRTLKVYVPQNVINEICHTFKISNATPLVKYPRLKDRTSEEIQETVAFLYQNNVTAKHLMSAPWLLCQTVDELKIKSKLLLQLKLFENFIDGLGFMLHTAEIIEGYSLCFEEEREDFSPYRNRIYYICSKLDLPVADFTIRIAAAWVILHIDKKKIDDVISMLQEYKIDPKDIVSDPWIFYHSVEKSKERLEAASHISSVKLKLWLCRCTKHSFQRYSIKYDPFFHWREDEDIHSVYQFLSSALSLDIKELEDRLGKRDELFEFTAIRMKRNFELLNDFGFTGKQIECCLEVLRKLPKEITRRFKLLKELDLQPEDISVSILAASSKRFENYYLKRKMKYEMRCNVSNN